MIGANAKRLFFDKPAVVRAVDRARRRVLSRAGAIVRRAAKKQLRKKRGGRPAKAGEPPTRRKGLLYKLTYFAYEQASQSAIVGPRLLRTKTAPTSEHTVPSVLETGGRVRAPRYRSRHGGQRYTRQVTLKYDPHPYMQPALRAEKDKVADVWKNSIRRS